jgi:peroxiredoxin
MKAMNSLVVLNAEGEAISVPTLWQKRRIILVFLRHFGCRFCKQQVRTMKVVQQRLKEAGTEVVLVSLGTPDQIERYRKELDIPACIEVYVDPEPDAPVAYAAFKLQSGRNLVLEHARVAELGSHALAEGNTDGGYASPTGPYTGSVFQVGGVFVLGAGNVCDYAYRSSYAGDHPNAAALLEAAAGITTHGMEYTYPTTTAWLERLSASRLATKATARASPTPSLVSVGVVLGMLGTLGLALGAAAMLSGMRAPPLPPPPPLSSAARLWLSSLTMLSPPPPPMPPPPPPAWRLLPNTPLGSPLATGRTSPLRVVLAALAAKAKAGIGGLNRPILIYMWWLWLFSN